MNGILKYVVTYFIFFLLGVWITYPLLFHLTSLTTGYGDELLIAWIHAWVIHALSTNPFHLFQTNIFYPFPNSLAFSETFLTTSVLTWPFMIFLKEPIAANNIIMISSIALMGFFTYLVTNYCTKSYYWSLISGILISFSPAFLSKVVHLQVLAIFWLPLSLYFLLRYLKEKKFYFFLLCLGCFVLQTLDSFMEGYFILLFLLIVGFFVVYKNKAKQKLFLQKRVCVSVVIALCFLVPIILPYLSVSKTYHYVRDIRDTIHFAFQPEDFLTTNSSSRLEQPFDSFWQFEHISPNAEVKSAFLGGVFTLLALFSIVYISKRWKQAPRDIKGIFIAGILGLVLSLGPFLHIDRLTIHHPFPIPLPYLLFYYGLPGFQGFRDSSRFELMFIISMGICSGYVLNKAITTRKQVIGLFLVLTILIIGEYNFPMHFVSIPSQKNFPPVYQWIKSNTPTNANIIEMPIFNWNMTPYAEIEQKRDYYSTLDFRNRVNGASGYSPQSWQDLITNLLVTFPSNNAIQNLKGLHINYIIVHASEYDRLHAQHAIFFHHSFENGKDIINKLKMNKELQLLTKQNNDYVFLIKPI